MRAGDKQLTCSDCGNEFVFTEKEAAYNQIRGFLSVPKRCKDCRRIRRLGKGANAYPIICGDCGRKVNVNFEPKGYKDIYCTSCYEKRIVFRQKRQ